MEPWNWHYYEVPETRVRPDDVVFDCGAAEGLFAFLVAPRCREVYCFEPVPEFRACLERTFAGQDNVTVVPVALGAAAGRGFMQMDGMSTALSEAESGLAVEIDTVDDFCVRTGVSPSYLKADLEGAEMQLLQGAAETIRRLKPRIAITTYHRSGDARALREFLASLRPDYAFRTKGIEHHWGEPIMLHAW
jgi:FkbM family methyltransferase